MLTASAVAAGIGASVLVPGRFHDDVMAGNTPWPCRSG
jgi:hypothetical protein